MATLQKIRNQGGILVSIFIGVALVAFIVGDALSSGSSLMNRSRNKIGEVAGESIDVQDYQNEITKNEEMAKMMSNLSALPEKEQQRIRESTWAMMVAKIILNQEYEALGLGLSAEELYDHLLGNNMDPNLRQIFTDPNTGVLDRERANQTAKMITAYPDNHPDKIFWLNTENQVATRRMMEKYNTLLSKGLYISKDQIKESAVNSYTTADLSYIMKSYSSISDSSVTVTQNEIKEYYNSHQYLFNQDELRQIEYVYFEVTPSAQDIEETKTWVEKIIPEFEAAPGIMEFARLSSEKRFDPVYYKKGELQDPALDEFIFTEKGEGVYGPYLKDNAYNILRVADRKMLPDSVKARHILIKPMGNDVVAAEKLADSLANVLRSGKGDFDLLAREYSTDGSSINGGDLGWFTQNMMVQPFSDSVFMAKKNEIKVVITQFGYHVVQVTDQSTPVEKVQLGIIAREITPSQQTINKIYNDARVFANDLTGYEGFNAAITEHNLVKRYASLNKNDQSFSSIEQARELVRQAYLTDKVGKVLMTNKQSPIFESGDKYIVAVLTSIQKEGIAPLQSVTSQIRRELIRKKKGEILAKELKDAAAGSESLLSIANRTNTEVIDVTDISFASRQLSSAGFEPKVIATVLGLKEGEISQPIIGTTGVFMAVVNSRTENTGTPEEIETIENSVKQMNMYRLYYGQGIEALEKDAGVIDLRYKFY